MIRIQPEDFSVDEVVSHLQTEGVGAVVTFTGSVRGTSRSGKEVVSVEWDVYIPMAKKEMEAIREDAISQYGLTNAAIVHRCGKQTPGDNLVLIAAASPHRKEAFAACAFIMDEIKKRAPLWKKEVYPDGTSSWIEG